MDPIQLARTLIDIPSVTGSEGPLGVHLAALLESSGYGVRSQTVEGDRRNLLAVRDANPRLIFCTHMDTVPPFFASSEDGVFLYGRGACDAKGIMAAMITAAGELAAEGRGDVGLLFVVGEETDSIGAKKAREISPGPDYIIVGEPTENRLGAAHKGALTVRLRTEGRSSHSAFPEEGKSAVDGLLDTLAALRRTDFGHDPVLGKTTLNIGLLSGGTAPNVVADHAEAVVSLRIARAPEVVLSRLKTAAGPDVMVEVIAHSPPQKLHTLPGYESVVLPFSTDISYLEGYGTPLLVGPGSVRDAHTDGEKIDKQELRRAVAVYKDLAHRLLAGI